jgi:curved DNA-binding protein CbpA
VSTDPFVDYYELLQVSPNADDDTIQRVFRHLAKKHHPDAASPGDPDRFNRLLDAYRTLTNVELRAAYDVRYQRHWSQTWRVAAEAATASPATDDHGLRHRILSLFYTQRRRNVRSPGLGELDLARVLEIPSELLAFHLWYLREKGWTQRLDTGQIAITAEGVDQVEQANGPVPANRLLEDSSGSSTAATAEASASPGPIKA